MPEVDYSNHFLIYSILALIVAVICNFTSDRFNAILAIIVSLVSMVLLFLSNWCG
jgi:hypothetical protein